MQRRQVALQGSVPGGHGDLGPAEVKPAYRRFGVDVERPVGQDLRRLPGGHGVRERAPELPHRVRAGVVAQVLVDAPPHPGREPALRDADCARLLGLDVDRHAPLYTLTMGPEGQPEEARDG